MVEQEPSKLKVVGSTPIIRFNTISRKSR